MKFIHYSHRFFAILACILCIACNSTDSSHKLENEVQNLSRIDALPQNQAGDIVRKAIQVAGGMENWESQKTLSYYKIIQYVDSTGTETRKLKQLHQYQLKPSLKFRIYWEEEGTEYIIVNNGEIARKFINGKISLEQIDIDHAWNSSYGSHYVFAMPFKLTDPGTKLEYAGLDTMLDGKIAHDIEVTYSPGAGSSAGYHTWNYYFDPEGGGLLANKIDFQSGISYTVYEAFETVEGVLINNSRKSYQVDPLSGRIGYLKTIYSNEEIQFDVDLPESLFKLE